MSDHERTAPLAFALTEVTAREPIRSFHALPLAQVRRTLSQPWADRFARLYDSRWGVDVSVSGTALDSFFAPSGPLEAAQELAASAFGVDAAFFGTCGTTLSNRIVLEALVRPGDRLLLDGASHQSLIFGSRARGIQVAVVEPKSVEGSLVPDLDGLERELGNAARAGRPYHAVAMTTSSYDGYLVKLDELLPRLLSVSPTTSIIFDSAWTAIHGFSSRLRRHTAFGAIERVRASGRGNLPAIVVTTSAHKSMCALRQGSYILVAGEPKLIDRVKAANFFHHTTSPSWPILASLDLARDHAENCGDEAVERAIALRGEFLRLLATDVKLSDLRPAQPDPFDRIPGLMQDPMKLSLPAGVIGPLNEVRRRLFAEHGVYVSRCTGTGLLLNFTIGIRQSDIDALLRALRSLRRVRDRASQPRPRDYSPGSVVREFIVPYPPGVPIVRPGDIWSLDHDAALVREVEAGAEIFRLAVQDHDRSIHHPEDRSFA